MKIRTKFIIIFMSVILITGLSVNIANQIISKKIIKEQIRLKLESTAHSRAFHIETLLGNYEKITTTLAAGNPYRDAVDIKLDLSWRMNQVKRRIKSTINNYPEIERIRILNKKGIIIASSHEDIGLDRSDKPIFINGKEKVYIGDIHKSEYTGNLVVNISAPILVKNKFAGVIILNFDAERKLFEILSEKTGLGETGETYLLNKDGYMISPSRFIDDVILKQKVDTPESRECWELSGEEKEEEREEIDIYRSYWGEMVIGTHYRITGTNWCLLAEKSLKEALAPIRKITNISIIILAVLLVLCIITSLILSDSITKPIKKLHKGADEVVKGNLDFKVGTKSKDELGQLSRAFDEMTQKLKISNEKLEKYSENLEEKVRERTAELEKQFGKSEKQRIANLVVLNDLNKTTKDLRAEITERKQAEERIDHLNLILRSIRVVNQLITKEKDRNVLIQQACEILTRNEGYHEALIALFDENNKLDIAVQSGIGSDFQLLTNNLKKGKLCNCIRKALNQPEVILIENPVVECKDCPISDVCGGRSAISVRLEYKNKVYGVLIASIEKKYLADEEMLDIFREVTGDIAFALYRLDLEAAHKKAEETKRASYNIASAVNTVDNLHELFVKIREYLGNVIDTTNFYVALYDEKTDKISLPYNVDEKDKFETFPAGKTLTAYVIETGKPLFAPRKLQDELTEQGKIEVIGTRSEIWLGVPLKVENKVVGVIVVQSYDNPNLYSKKDIDILTFISEEIALAIKHKQADEQIRRDLKEKEILLNEIHHRVKNNLQVISGLLMLQQNEIATKEDALKGFAASQDRILAMAKAYELLLGSEYMSDVSAGKYIESLAEQLKYNYDIHRKVNISYSLPELTISIEILDRLGLILNEIITNSIKYAFEGREAGNIHIELKETEKHIVIKISDDGIGMPEEIDINNPSTLGLSLVEMLTVQLQGTLKLDRKNGTSFTLKIPKESYEV